MFNLGLQKRKLLLGVVFLSLLFCSTIFGGCSKPSEEYVDGYKNGYKIGELTVKTRGLDGAKSYWEGFIIGTPREQWIAMYIQSNPEEIKDPQALEEASRGVWNGMEDSMLGIQKKH